MVLFLSDNYPFGRSFMILKYGIRSVDATYFFILKLIGLTRFARVYSRASIADFSVAF